MTPILFLSIYVIVNVLAFIGLFILEGKRLGRPLDKKQAAGLLLFCIVGPGIFLFFTMLGIYLTRKNR